VAGPDYTQAINWCPIKSHQTCVLDGLPTTGTLIPAVRCFIVVLGIDTFRAKGVPEACLSSKFELDPVKPSASLVLCGINTLIAFHDKSKASETSPTKRISTRTYGHK